jgi:5,6-dimethylbenzimidazole synthase
MMQPPASIDLAPVFDEEFRARLLELFKWRRDVRAFQRKPVPPGVLEELMGTLDFAPSVGLSQPWRFVIIDDAARRAAVKASFETCNAEALAGQEETWAGLYARLKLAGLDDAPCHIAVCVEPSPIQGRGLGRATMPETTTYSAVIAIHTLWLAARTVGLGLGWVSILDPTKVLTALDLPNSWRLIAYLCVGYPEIENANPELERLGWEYRRPAKSHIVYR